MNKKKSLILSVIGLLGLIVITIGVTFSLFTYIREGTTDNTITTGTITFLYTEVTGVGKGISLIDAYPTSDSQGKNLTGEGKVFDFKITSINDMNASIPYEITARKNNESTLDEEAVRLYFTKVSGDTEEEILLDNYSNLVQTSRIDKEKNIEKIIYTGKVPANVGKYEQAFRLRMWVDENIDFSPVEDNEGNISYPYNNKEFTVTVNVYANAKVVTEEEIDLEKNTEITSLSVNGEKLELVTGQSYDYITTLSADETKVTFDIATKNPNATVTINQVDNLVYSSNIRKLGLNQEFYLTSLDNYFNITVTSENKKVINTYVVRIKLIDTMDENYSLLVGQKVTAIDNSNWYVLENSASGDGYVTLIAKYNINSSGKQSSSCDVNSNTNRCGFIFDKDNTNIYDEIDSNNIGYFIKNTYEPLILASLPGTTNVTIPTADQIAKADGKTFNQKSIEIENEWLLVSNYWLKTSVKNSNTDVFVVSGFYRDIQTCDSYRESYDVGLRPVITTLKSNLLAESSDITIRSISVNNQQLVSTSDSEYDYEVSFPSDIKSAMINIETLNPYTKISIEPINDSLVFSSNVVRLSTTKNFQLTAGDNIFKIVVTSEDEKVTKEYKLRISVDYQYKIGQLLTTNDGSKWYVLENSGLYDENITLISRYNINSSGKQSSACDVYSDTSVCGFIFDTKNSNVYDETNVNNVGYFIKNTYEPLVIAALPGTINVTIPTADQIAALNNVEFNNKAYNITLSWLQYSNFWLKTPVNNSTTNVWAVSGYSAVTVKVPAKRTTYDVGIRSVITTPKTNLLVQ